MILFMCLFVYVCDFCCVGKHGLFDVFVLRLLLLILLLLQMLLFVDVRIDVVCFLWL